MTRRLQIEYHGASGLTERTLRDPVLTDEWHISGYCELRQAERTFSIDSIARAVDLDTGERIEDLYRWTDRHLPIVIPMPGPPDPPRPPPSRWLPGEPLRPTATDPREIYRGQRSREKSAFQGRYRLRSIFELYRQRLLAAFGDRCFKCGAAPPLVLDHHHALILGGHTVPGNLVPLCRRCNGRKLDRPAEQFYGPDELERLAPLLAAQPALLAFHFNRARWQRDRRAYLLDVGLDAETVERIFTDPDHPDHCREFPESGPAISASIEATPQDPP